MSQSKGVTSSSTSAVVTRGDEKSSPWNPLLCLCKEIFPSTEVYTHTQELCVSMLISPLLRVLHYPLALLRAK